MAGLLQQPAKDPLSALQRVLRHRARELTADELELGCSLNNLAQEMSPLDERFRRVVNATFEVWRNGFAQALGRGQMSGSVRRDVDAKKVSAFVVAAAEAPTAWPRALRAR